MPIRHEVSFKFWGLGNSNKTRFQSIDRSFGTPLHRIFLPSAALCPGRARQGKDPSNQVDYPLTANSVTTGTPEADPHRFVSHRAFRGDTGRRASPCSAWETHRVFRTDGVGPVERVTRWFFWEEAVLVVLLGLLVHVLWQSNSRFWACCFVQTSLLCTNLKTGFFHLRTGAEYHRWGVYPSLLSQAGATEKGRRHQQRKGEENMARGFGCLSLFLLEEWVSSPTWARRADAYIYSCHIYTHIIIIDNRIRYGTSCSWIQVSL